ncbi:hypothetical protein HDU83_004067 [Entophlyctis luteolus]|nr:hypothetical protein HDU83_004067 [Entophlyctis luteolus]
MKMQYVYVKNGFRTSGDHMLVAISHLWPKPLDKGQSFHSNPPKLSEEEKLDHGDVKDLYVYQSEYVAKPKEGSWVEKRIQQSIIAVKALFANNYKNQEFLIWLDVVCIDQSQQLSIRDATYAMSIVYHIADLTIALLSDTKTKDDVDTCSWEKRRWTLQELELSHHIAYYHLDASSIDWPEKLESGRYNLHDALAKSHERDSYYEQDLVYAVRGLVPSLFQLPAVYDVTVDHLIARAAMVAAKEGDFSMLAVNGNEVEGNGLVRVLGKVEPKVEDEEICRVPPMDHLAEIGFVFQTAFVLELTEEKMREVRNVQVESFKNVTKLEKLQSLSKSLGLFNCNSGAWRSVDDLAKCLKSMKTDNYTTKDWPKVVETFKREFLVAYDMPPAYKQLDLLTNCVMELDRLHPSYIGAQELDKRYGLRHEVTWGEIVLREKWLVQEITRLATVQSPGWLVVLASDHPDGGIRVRKFDKQAKYEQKEAKKNGENCPCGKCYNSLFCAIGGFTDVLIYAPNKTFSTFACALNAELLSVDTRCGTPYGLLDRKKASNCKDLFKVSYGWTPLGIRNDKIHCILSELGAGKTKAIVVS